MLCAPAILDNFRLAWNKIPEACTIKVLRLKFTIVMTVRS